MAHLARLLIGSVLVSTITVSSVWSASSRDNPPKSNDIPSAFSVYSKDGRESLWGRCLPMATSAGTAAEIECSFVKIEFEPATEFRTVITEIRRAESLAKTPEEEREARDAIKSVLKVFGETLCSPDTASKLLAGTENREKTRAFFEQIKKTCATGDSGAVLKAFTDNESRTCNVHVDSFTLDFQRIGEGRWFNKTQPQALLCGILKVYELRHDGTYWNLTETRLSADTREECAWAKDEVGKMTVWSGKKRTTRTSCRANLLFID